MKSFLLIALSVLASCQLQIIPVMEGILVGMADISTDLSSCASDPGQIISSFEAGVYWIQQGVTMSNLINAFDEFYNAAQTIQGMIGACEGVINGYETIEAEIENVVGIFSNPAYYLSMDAVRVLWNV